MLCAPRGCQEMVEVGRGRFGDVVMLVRKGKEKRKRKGERREGSG